jgi:hypothetical protein
VFESISDAIIEFAFEGVEMLLAWKLLVII